MDVQRTTYCEEAMELFESTRDADYLRVVDYALNVYDANGLPNHANRHLWDGVDPIQGQQLLGLRAIDDPTFNELTLTDQLLADDGLVGAPGVSWAANPNTGLYRIGANNVGFAANGALIFDYDANSIDITSGIDVVPGASWTCNLGADGYRFNWLYTGQVWQASNSVGGTLNYIDNYQGTYWYVGPAVMFRRARGSKAAPAAVAANDYLGRIVWWGYDGGAWEGAAEIVCQAIEAFDATHEGTRIKFFNTDSGDTASTEYMRLDGSGETIDFYKRIDIQGGTAVNGNNGWNGNWVNAAGDTVTVEDGIITDVS